MLWVVIPPSGDAAHGAPIWRLIHVGLRLGAEVQRVVRLHLLLALPPGMNELKRFRRISLVENRVDRRVCFILEFGPIEFAVIPNPRHGGGAGSKVPNNGMLEMGLSTNSYVHTHIETRLRRIIHHDVTQRRRDPSVHPWHHRGARHRRGPEFVVGNAPFAGVRQQLNMAECVYNLDTSDVGSWMIMLGRINAARRGHSWYVRVVNLECTVRRL